MVLNLGNKMPWKRQTIKRQDCPQDVQDMLTFFDDRLKELDIRWLSDGSIVTFDPMSDAFVRMRENHLRCILRKDYVEKHGHHPLLHINVDGILRRKKEKALRY